MKENYLHALFQNRSLGSVFTTTKGKSVKIIDFGTLNANAGPDFLNAKIELNNTIWVGHIEFHLNSSDWLKHMHQNDTAYDNVILHMVYKHDHDIYSGKYKLPTVEIAGIIDVDHFLKYEKIVSNKLWIPCASQLKFLPTEFIEAEILKQFEIRINRKAVEILKLIDLNDGNENKVFYALLAKAFGGKVNGDAFQDLLNSIEINQLAKLNYSPSRIQALFFGVANMLPKQTSNPYEAKLINEFHYLQTLFNLKVSNNKSFKYSTMRPFGFPDIRIAQFTGVLAKNPSVKEFLTSTTALYSFFDIELDEYWKTHFRLGNVTKLKSEKLSKSFIENLIINVVIPYTAALKLRVGLPIDISAVKHLLSELPAEKNRIIQNWKRVGTKVTSAYTSQGLIELKNEYCSQKKCLFCAIGKKVLEQ